VKHRHKHNKSNELKEELCEQEKQYKKTLDLSMKIKHRQKNKTRSEKQLWATNLRENGEILP